MALKKLFGFHSPAMSGCLIGTPSQRRPAPPALTAPLVRGPTILQIDAIDAIAQSLYAVGRQENARQGRSGCTTDRSRPIHPVELAPAGRQMRTKTRTPRAHTRDWSNRPTQPAHMLRFWLTWHIVVALLRCTPCGIGTTVTAGDFGAVGCRVCADGQVRIFFFRPLRRFQTHS